MRGPDSRSGQRARRLRGDQTDVERKLWLRLNNRQLAGVKFVRQEPVGPYFGDFVCREHRIVVELDGHQHADSTRDKTRGTFLRSEGYRVLRFWNGEVNANLQGVLDTIYAAVEERVSLSPQGGERSSRTSVRPGEGQRTRPVDDRAPHPVAAAPRSTSPRLRGEEGALASNLRERLVGLRGTLEPDAPMAPLSWFRTGGPAEVLFTPADEDDLALFLAGCPADIPILVVGLGSNLLVRDGGVPGVVIRLGKPFAGIRLEQDHRIRAGAGAADVKVARAAAEAGIDGLTFLRGIPGMIGGALRMNGGAYGGETADVLVEAQALDRAGNRHVLDLRDMAYTYRHCGAPDDLIFTEAVFEGRPGVPEAILVAMGAITDARSSTQPVNTRTGGSTFKNPPSAKAWELIDRAGCRGLTVGAAQVSELHCNFLINHGGATAAEIEALGEEVRRRVREASGVELEWEIRRVGQDISVAVEPSAT